MEQGECIHGRSINGCYDCKSNSMAEEITALEIINDDLRAKIRSLTEQIAQDEKADEEINEIMCLKDKEIQSLKHKIQRITLRKKNLYNAHRYLMEKAGKYKRSIKILGIKFKFYRKNYRDAMALARKCEWCAHLIGSDLVSGGQGCPVCKSLKNDGHAEDCEFSILKGKQNENICP